MPPAEPIPARGRGLALVALMALATLGIGGLVAYRSMFRATTLAERWELGPDASYGTLLHTAPFTPARRKLCRLEPGSTVERWCRSVPSGASIVALWAAGELVVAQLVVAGDAAEPGVASADAIWAIDPTDGADVVRTTFGQGNRAEASTLAEGAMLFVAWPDPPTLRAIDTRTRDTRWSIPLESPPPRPSLREGDLVVGSRRYDPQTGAAR